MKTTFGVAIPTHNRCETVLLATLSALRQTRPPEQVIVLCDGCTDTTVSVIRALDDGQQGLAHGTILIEHTRPGDRVRLP